ncbi:MAG: glycosyltransferase family 4 protein [Flavobacterium sp.]|nr:glycosyltransferase family 4 protein [Flavobacterium sp.]
MKVLYLTKYPRKGASSRLRSYQFFPLLEAAGIEVTAQSFFNEIYLNNLYAKKSNGGLLIFSFYLKRFFAIFTAFRYDKIVIEKEIFPYFFSWFEKIFFYLKIEYIVDYDDAIFHNYDLNTSKFIRFFLKNKIANVMKYSGCVMAGNSYLYEKAKNSGAKKVIKQPTVIDLEKYNCVEKSANSKVVIGWIGSPTTFKYVTALQPVFERLLLKYDIEIQIVGAKEDIGLGDAMQYILWNENTEVEAISKFDIGIMPLENTPWELGKCSYKLIQYMGCGKPVVGSAVGMNNEVIDDTKNGFLVFDDCEWYEKLSVLIENKTLRNQFGIAGRQKVAGHYNLENNFKKLLTILSNAS